MDTVFQKIVNMFQDVNKKLKAGLTEQQVNDCAHLIYRGMTKNARCFHTPEHIFQLADGSDAIQSLAALFHDLVYYQVDEGFIPEIQSLITPHIIHNWLPHSIIINKIPQKDRKLLILLDVFNVHPGQQLDPGNGMNEFLSALVMNKCFEGNSIQKSLLKANLCIEATIPFRGVNPAGKSVPDVLEQRMFYINEKYDLKMSDEEIFHSISCATLFSNRDVENFSENDTSIFLDNTWKLLPEINPSLRFRDVYTVKEYRKALLAMETFLSGLEARTIYNRYHNVPPLEEYEMRLHNAQRNIEIARDYLGIKLVAIAVIEALADLSGGDTPIGNFMGPINETKDKPRLETYLPQVDLQSSSTMVQLLKTGRATASSFDIKDSPTSLYFYCNIGLEGMRHLLVYAKSMFKKKFRPIEFLRLIEMPILQPVIEASAMINTSRREEILAIQKKLYK